MLDWARCNGSWIVEDDYTGEFRYEGWPLPALKSLDSGDRVLYIGTFSKTMSPGLRIGYLIVPESMVVLFGNHVRRLEGGRATLEQAALASSSRMAFSAGTSKRCVASIRPERRRWPLQ